MSLWDKIESREAIIGVVGLGYVGLPTATMFAEGGFRILGYDVDDAKVERLQRGESYVGDVDAQRFAQLVEEGRFEATTHVERLEEADVVLVCVPTPLNKTRDPDVSYVVAATESLRSHLKRGALVVLESTTYPGFTREVLAESLAEPGYVIGVDLYVAFSPERIDPGNRTYGPANTPKVIGGLTPTCTRYAARLYEHVVTKVVPVSSPDCAEMVKLLENTFRAVNIGLVNEIAIMCNRLDLDTWEVIDAASTKPFGFMAFYPGPGLGGHCIPIDPKYLSWRMKNFDYNARFIELADSINSSMPRYVVQLVADALNEDGLAINGARLLVVGVAYKPDIDDIRESPALDIMELLALRGADMDYYDPWVPALNYGGVQLTSVAIDDGLGEYDAVIICTPHTTIDYASIADSAKLIVDTRNATRELDGRGARIVRL